VIVDLEKRWVTEALCSTKDPEIFFTDQALGTEPLTNPSHKVQSLWNVAKRICADCPVVKECARDSLGEIEGVWGGLDPGQRVRLRRTHNENIRNLTGPVKLEYQALAYELLMVRKMMRGEAARIIGCSPEIISYLVDLERERREAVQAAAEAAREAVSGPEKAEAEVSYVGPEFPDRNPSEGDCWVRYGRRVVWGYYLGQTDDDQWFHLKVKVFANEYSLCWIKAEDVKLVRDVARNVLTRVGNGSRIYGTALTIGHRGTPEAG